MNGANAASGICATPLPCTDWFPGIVPEQTCSDCFLNWQPILVISISPVLNATSL